MFHDAEGRRHNCVLQDSKIIEPDFFNEKNQLQAVIIVLSGPRSSLYFLGVSDAIAGFSAFC
jgi:hypothetical protein